MPDWRPRMPLFPRTMRCFPFNNYFKLFWNDWNDYSSGNHSTISCHQSLTPVQWLSSFQCLRLFTHRWDVAWLITEQIEPRKGRRVPWHSWISLAWVNTEDVAQYNAHRGVQWSSLLLQPDYGSVIGPRALYDGNSPSMHAYWGHKWEGHPAPLQYR